MLARRRPSIGRELLQDRFIVSYGHILGEGSYSMVYRGIDEETKSSVAVKIYKGHPVDAPDVFRDSLVNFLGAVEIMEALASCGTLSDALAECPPQHLRGSERARSFRPEMIEDCFSDVRSEKERRWLEDLNLKRCFADIIGYSRGTDGRPGPDAATGKLFIATNVGDESLASFFRGHAADETSLSVEELRDLHWSLMAIVCGLHVVGYVHLDIKPVNIMRFGASDWRLIDYDGCVKTRTVLQRDKIVVTPLYMAPEIAAVQIRRGDDTTEDLFVEVSRLMDVWSVGMCALEAIFLQPVLKPWYDEWLDSKHAASSDLQGCTTFLTWLGDYSKPVMDDDMYEAIRALDPEVAKLLVGMLAKDPQKRLSITECITHAWFEPVRQRFGMSPTDTASPSKKQSRAPSKASRSSSKSTMSLSRVCSVM
mmetsp:Transcript_22062/g.61804  ORF Transcript_22062/g.61804 Transcript_22062/m.61804 type:complete len:424 (-) Transcript_22062:68-1339(-)